MLQATGRKESRMTQGQMHMRLCVTCLYEKNLEEKVDKETQCNNIANEWYSTSAVRIGYDILQDVVVW